MAGGAGDGPGDLSHRPQQPGARDEPELHPPQQSQAACEPFYRSRRRVGYLEVLAELQPLDERLYRTPTYEYDLKPARKKDVFSREEYLKFRRLERRWANMVDNGVRVYYSLENDAWVVDERSVGGGVTALPAVAAEEIRQADR